MTSNFDAALTSAPAPLERSPARVFVLGDSLTYHGPDQAERPSDPRLWPQVMASELASTTGTHSRSDLAAGLGWTARDGWWALTKDPRCWGELLPVADAVVVALGGMDQLPAAIPTYLREGIAVVRPGGLRRVVRRTYRTCAPPIMRLTGGRLRQLPQAATDRYLTRIVTAVRILRPDIPLLVLSPAPFRSRYYPTAAGHEPARAACREWAERERVELLDLDPLVWPGIRAGTANPDGLHWGWDTHRAVGQAVAQRLLTLAPTGPAEEFQ